MKRFLLLATAAGIVFCLDYTTRAQDFDPGRNEYESSCATCHGTDAKGNGPIIPLLKVMPPDLTVLAKKNNGIFPFRTVYQVIDGRQPIKTGTKPIKAHGPPDMPIWGNRYTQSQTGQVIQGPLDFTAEVLVRNRILAIIDYLNRIQEK